MAEGICRKLLARRLGTGPDELEDRGILVMSAGVAAMTGGRATPEAVQVASGMELDLSQHETQPLTEPLVRYADLIFTMTQSHRQAVIAGWPSSGERVRVLKADGSDVSDPIGGPLERYERCAAEIESALAARLDEIVLEANN
jgi:protein-tyrosine phosphatase